MILYHQEYDPNALLFHSESSWLQEIIRMFAQMDMQSSHFSDSKLRLVESLILGSTSDQHFLFACSLSLTCQGHQLSAWIL